MLNTTKNEDEKKWKKLHLNACSCSFSRCLKNIWKKKFLLVQRCYLTYRLEMCKLYLSVCYFFFRCIFLPNCNTFGIVGVSFQKFTLNCLFCNDLRLVRSIFRCKNASFHWNNVLSSSFSIHYLFFPLFLPSIHPFSWSVFNIYQQLFFSLFIVARTKHGFPFQENENTFLLNAQFFLIGFTLQFSGDFFSRAKKKEWMEKVL